MLIQAPFLYVSIGEKIYFSLFLESPGHNLALILEDHFLALL